MFCRGQLTKGGGTAFAWLLAMRVEDPEVCSVVLNNQVKTLFKLVVWLVFQAYGKGKGRTKGSSVVFFSPVRSQFIWEYIKAKLMLLGFCSFFLPF